MDSESQYVDYKRFLPPAQVNFCIRGQTHQYLCYYQAELELSLEGAQFQLNDLRETLKATVPKPECPPPLSRNNCLCLWPVLKVLKVLTVVQALSPLFTHKPTCTVLPKPRCRQPKPWSPNPNSPPPNPLKISENFWLNR